MVRLNNWSNLMNNTLREPTFITKGLNKPSLSLRLVFWSLVTSSVLFWTLALFLLTSCSGSIFSSKKDAPPQAPVNPQGQGQSTQRPIAQQNPQANTGPTVEYIPRESAPPTNNPQNSSVRLHPSQTKGLNVLRVLFPESLKNYTKPLSQLYLNISVSPVQSRQGDFDIRRIDFHLHSSPHDSAFDSKSFSAVVVEDRRNPNGLREFFAKGKLTEQNTELALSLAYEAGTLKNARLVVYSADKQKEPKGYLLLSPNFNITLNH
jgi:hypothetical protein